MKKILSFILLLSIITRPAIHIGTIAYYQFNLNEIVDKYCVNKDKPARQCDGKCYLSQQLGLTDSASEDGVLPNFNESFVPLFYVDNSFSFSSNSTQSTPNETPFYSNFYSFQWLVENSIPPEV